MTVERPLIRQGEGRLWLKWVLAYAVATVWSQSPGIRARTAASTLSGASIGTAQWLLLRRRFSGAGWWIPAAVAGAALEPILDLVRHLPGSDRSILNVGIHGHAHMDLGVL